MEYFLIVLVLTIFLMHMITAPFRRVIGHISDALQVPRKIALLLLKSINPALKQHFIKEGSPELAAKMLVISGIYTDQGAFHLARVCCHLDTIGIQWRMYGGEDFLEVCAYLQGADWRKLRADYGALTSSAEFKQAVTVFEGRKAKL